VPEVLSVDEIGRILVQMREGHRLLARLQYAAGLRVKDVDFETKQSAFR